MGIEDIRLLRKLYPDRYEAKQLEQNLPDSPQQVLPVVTQSDASNGYITRYFVRPGNDKLLIYEVDKNQYERFKENPRFVVAKIKWKIVGQKETTFTSYGARLVGVEDFNRKAVSDTDLTFGGLQYYIQDYLQYWQVESTAEFIVTGSAQQNVVSSPTPTPSPTVIPSPTPTPTPSTSVRRTASVIGYTSPTVTEDGISSVAFVKATPSEGQYYVGSSVTFSYENVAEGYTFVNWASTTLERQIQTTITVTTADGESQEIEVPDGIETFQEVATVLGTDPTLTLTIPPEGIKIKANFRRS